MISLHLRLNLCYSNFLRITAELHCKEIIPKDRKRDADQADISFAVAPMKIDEISSNI